MFTSSYRPSRLTLQSGRAIELQLTVPCFTLRLYGSDGACTNSFRVMGWQLESLFIDQKPLSLPPVNMYQSQRLVVIEMNGRVWDRVSDGDFMRLKVMSCTGHGEDATSP